LTVAKAATSVQADNATGNPGLAVSVPVTVTSAATAKPTGTITEIDGSTQVGTGTLSGGSATISVDTTGLDVGDNTLTVNYGGAANFASSTKDITLTLSKVSSTVTAGDQNATYGSAGSLTATVTASFDVNGTVTFSEGVVPLGQANVGSDGTATLALAEVTLGAGPHTITAAYGGNVTLDPSSTTFTLTVAKAGTTVVASNVVAFQGTTPSVAVTVTSSATAKPGGSVEVRDASNNLLGTDQLTNGAVTISMDISTLAGGSNTVTVKYLGASNYAVSQKNITVTVYGSAKKPATVTAPNVTVTYGKTVALPITVKGSAGTPTGQVQVRYGSTSLGSVTLQGGKGTLTIPAKSLAPGARAVSLKYSGDAVYAPATGTATVNVTKVVSHIANALVDGPIKANTSGPKLRVVVSATSVTPTGTVSIVIGSQTVQGTLVGGQVTILLPTFSAAGTYSAKIQYSGDDYARSATKTITLTVRHQ
jgi:hypothetical protein